MLCIPLVRVEILFGHLISDRIVVMHAELPLALAKRLLLLSRSVVVTEQDAEIVRLRRGCQLRANARTIISPYWHEAATVFHAISVLTNQLSDEGGFTIRRVRLMIDEAGDDAPEG